MLREMQAAACGFQREHSYLLENLGELFGEGGS